MSVWDKSGYATTRLFLRTLYSWDTFNETLVAHAQTEIRQMIKRIWKRWNICNKTKLDINTFSTYTVQLANISTWYILISLYHPHKIFHYILVNEKLKFREWLISRSKISHTRRTSSTQNGGRQHSIVAQNFTPVITVRSEFGNFP